MKVTIILALALLAGACESVRMAGPAARQDPVGSDARELVVNGIRASLELEPAEVERTHPFRATLTLRNTQATPATWTGGMGCIAFLNVYRRGERVPLRGTDFVCTGVVTTRMLQPGESYVTSWNLVAQTTDGTPLMPGEYVFEADPVLASGKTLQHVLGIR
jgi:hypothetical protein